MRILPQLGMVVMLACISFSSHAQAYLQMMQDPSVNFYDVCKAADAYFETHPTGKGSGYKPYLRWKADNESKFYPSGDRSQVDFRIAAKSAAPFQHYFAGTQRNNTTRWVELGPDAANNITDGYNPGIGRVETFYVDPNNDQLLYLGSRSGGFWRSTDGGQNWANTTDSLIASGVNQIAVSPTNPNYVVINVRNGRNATSFGLYLSTDGGLTWTESDFNPDNLGFGGLGDNFQIYKLAFHPQQPNKLYVGSNRGLFTTNAAITSWTQTLNNADITDIEFHPTDSNTMYFYDNYYWGSNGNRVLFTNDGGATFSSSSSIAGNNDAEGFISVTPMAPDNVYFASNNGVWKSTNKGVDFTLLSIPTESCDGFAVSDLDSIHMIYGYLELQASANGGNNFATVTTWNSTNPGTDYTHADLRTAECVNGVFYVGTDGYLAKSADNGITWTRLNDGTAIREFYCTGVSQGQYRTFMAGSQDNGTSVLDETGWIEWNGGDGMEAQVHTLNPLWMIGSWQYGTRSISRDGGLSRQGSGNPSSGSDSADWEAPMFFDPNNQMRIYHFGTRLGISDDFGDTWYYGPDHQLGQRPTKAAIAYNNTQIMAGTKAGLIRVTFDAWATSFTVNAGLTGNYIRDITFAPNHDSTIVVTYDSYQNNNQKVYITHNLGQTWQNITYNLTNMPVLSVAVDHSDDENIYIGTEWGVFVKPMNGTVWAPLAYGMPNVTTRDLDIHFGSNTLKASTWGRGLWEAPLLNRQNYPHILETSITNPPSEFFPKSGYDQYVTAVVSSLHNVSDVFVKWSANAPTFDSTLTMSVLSDSTYTTDQPFPYYPKDTKMYFKVYAVNQVGDTSVTHKFMYTIKPGLQLSIHEATQQSSLNVFPNPNAGKFYVAFGAPVVSGTVQVFNMAGQEVFVKNVSGNGQEIYVDAPAGIYTVVLQSENGRMTQKFTIQ